MRKYILLQIALFVLAFNSSVAEAADDKKLSCRMNKDNNVTICYRPNEVRANGEIRSFMLYTGGPKGVEKTGQTAMFYCKQGFFEMQDKNGVVITRTQPSKLYIIQMREDICSEQNVKLDKTLN